MDNTNKNAEYTFKDFLKDEDELEALRLLTLYKKYEKTKSRVILFIPSLEHEQAVIFNKLNHLHFIYEIECCKRGIEPESLYNILNKKELA